MFFTCSAAPSTSRRLLACRVNSRDYLRNSQQGSLCNMYLLALDRSAERKGEPSVPKAS